MTQLVRSRCTEQGDGVITVDTRKIVLVANRMNHGRKTTLLKFNTGDLNVKFWIGLMWQGAAFALIIQPMIVE